MVENGLNVDVDIKSAIKDSTAVATKILKSKKFRTADSIPRIGVIPTPLEDFNNEIFVIGGVPKGRVVEFFGRESSGKTTLALHTVAQAQKMGMLCVLADAEGAHDCDWAEKAGVDNSKLLILDCDSTEEYFNEMAKLIGIVDLIVLDSLAVLQPKDLWDDGEVGSEAYGKSAKINKAGIKLLTSGSVDTKKLRDSNTAIIIINQVIAQPGGSWGDSETTPGGRYLKFISAVRVGFKDCGKKSGEDFVRHCKAICKKNKLGTAMSQSIDFYIDIEHNTLSPFREKSLGDILVEKQLAVKRRGRTYLIVDGKEMKKGKWEKELVAFFTGDELGIELAKKYGINDILIEFLNDADNDE